MFQVALAKASVPLVERFLSSRRRVIGLNNFERELLLSFERMRVRWRSVSKEQVIIARHQSVRDTHQFPEHLRGGLVNCDKVAETFAHFLRAIQSSRIGSRKTTCCGKPSSFWKSRPIKMLKSWSVPPSSTSAITITESQPCMIGY